MAIVVLGQHQGERPQEPFQPGRGLPAQLTRVPPPDVQLAEGETGQCAGPGDSTEQRGDGEVRQGAQESVEQDGGIRREHRVVEVRSAAIVMGSQVEREPEMLRNVIEKRRRKISGDQCGDEGNYKVRSGGDLVMQLHSSYHIPHERAR